MRIVVPVKQVPETGAVKMDEATGTMIRAGVEAIINPLDLYAVETAVRIREQAGGQVIAISMGPPSAAKAIREALAMGCDSGALISHRAFAGSDTWATAVALAAAVRRIGAFDLILCGERATDGDTGQVGPELAAMLGLPIATYVGRVEQVAADRVIVHRLVENGHEVLDVPLPAVLTVVKEAADPRLPTLQDKRRARAAAIPVWTAEDLGVDPSQVGLQGSPTRVVRIHRPKLTRSGTKVVVRDERAIAAAADELVALLRERGAL